MQGVGCRGSYPATLLPFYTTRERRSAQTAKLDRVVQARADLSQRGAEGRSSLQTLHPTHPTPYTLHPTPYTLHPTPYTSHQHRLSWSTRSSSSTTKAKPGKTRSTRKLASSNTPPIRLSPQFAILPAKLFLGKSAFRTQAATSALPPQALGASVYLTQSIN